LEHKAHYGDIDPLAHIATEIRVMLMIGGKLSARRMEQHLAEQGIDLSALQMGVLRVISDQPKTISELGRNFVLDPSTLVPVIDTLERKGYVERRKDPNDRRRTPVCLTEHGQGLVAQVGWMPEKEPLLPALQALGSEKAEQLVTLLREMMMEMPEAREMLAEMEERLRVMGVHRPPQESDS
jgi:DNA-binding MarR family transcriptional regulator